MELNKNIFQCDFEWSNRIRISFVFTMNSKKWIFWSLLMMFFASAQRNMNIFFQIKNVVVFLSMNQPVQKTSKTVSCSSLFSSLKRIK